MIISASRRTDLPAFYSEWLFNRLREEFVLVRNPMNIHQVSRINLSPNVVDGIVFWTKNPVPMLKRISEIEKYTYYFQYTLTAYDKDVEANLPSKNEVLIPAFQTLSKLIGKERVVWRYDPILFNDHYTMDYHCKYFRVLAAKLGEYTEKCTISFIDLYRNTARNVKQLGIYQDKKDQQIEIAQRFAGIASEYGIYVDTCAEKIDLGRFKIPHACCIDRERFERIGGYSLALGKDPNQREECGCIASIDIGAYNTCKHGCRYCYANYSQSTVINNSQAHDPHSPILFGKLNEDDIIKNRQVKSYIDNQMSIFNTSSQ